MWRTNCLGFCGTLNTLHLPLNCGVRHFHRPFEIGSGLKEIRRKRLSWSSFFRELYARAKRYEKSSLRPSSTGITLTLEEVVGLLTGGDVLTKRSFSFDRTSN